MTAFEAEIIWRTSGNFVSMQDNRARYFNERTNDQNVLETDLEYFQGNENEVSL